MEARDIFRKIAKASASGGGNPIKDGRYKLLVKRHLLKHGFKGWAWITEFLVAEATKTNPDVEPNAVGSTCSFVGLIEKNVCAEGNVKAFLLALVGSKESEVAEDDFIGTMEFLADLDGKNGNPGCGMAIACETYRKAKASKPSEILVLPNWAHIAQTPEEIKAGRAMVEAAEAAAKAEKAA